MDCVKALAFPGRSPRMRGKLCFSKEEIDRARSIPAYAGETGAPISYAHGPQVDPRVCGGNVSGCSLRKIRSGRSPRMRGKRQCAAHRTHVERSIPAYAGETASSTIRRWSFTVDPRVCGGNSRPMRRSSSSRGRSPRMRGKHGARGMRPASHRSIPAYAGETRRPARRSRGASVDPRVCGGNDTTMMNMPVFPGRSPRMRGKLQLVKECAVHPRSIPAYAGETKWGLTGKRSVQVDPRVCGGNLASPPRISLRPGRSPRMRGKQRPNQIAKAAFRSIPAYAGETIVSIASMVPISVDPRVCGGNCH